MPLDKRKIKRKEKEKQKKKKRRTPSNIAPEVTPRFGFLSAPKLGSSLHRSFASSGLRCLALPPRQRLHRVVPTVSVPPLSPL